MVVHLPAFRLERCGFSPDDLAAVVAEERSAIRVVAATPAARAEGIHPGTTAAEARALLPEIELLPLQADEESADRRELLHAFGSLSDRIATFGDDDLVLDVSCSAHLFGGEAGVVAAAHAIAERLGHRSHVALADDPIGAAAIARFDLAKSATPFLVVPVGTLGRALADLPLAALGPSPQLLTSLRVVGLRWIREFAGLDPASVAGRWGEEAVKLLRVACGHATGITASTQAEADPVAFAAPLAGATTLAQVQFALTGVLGCVVREAAARDEAIVRLKLLLRQEHAAPLAVGVRVGRPTRDLEVLERLVKLRLEGVRLSSPISELVVEVCEVAPAIGWQPGLVDRTEATEPLPDLLARLMDALGEQAVFSPALVDSWRPEAAWEPVPFAYESALAGGVMSKTKPGLAEDPVEAQDQWAPPLSRPRPVVLLPTPKRIEVDEVDGRPQSLSLSFESSSGEGRVEPAWMPHPTRWSIRRADGPERLTGEWWRTDDPLERDYWVVAFGDRVAWVFRQRTSWFIHGWFD
jgi:protein ImuB